jgi:hypothetical protein
MTRPVTVDVAHRMMLTPRINLIIDSSALSARPYNIPLVAIMKLMHTFVRFYLELVWFRTRVSNFGLINAGHSCRISQIWFEHSNMISTAVCSFDEHSPSWWKIIYKRAINSQRYLWLWIYLCYMLERLQSKRTSILSPKFYQASWHSFFKDFTWSISRSTMPITDVTSMKLIKNGWEKFSNVVQNSLTDAVASFLKAQ